MARGSQICRHDERIPLVQAKQAETGAPCKFGHGSWPVVTGPEPTSPHTGSTKQWDFPNVLITEIDKKMIIGEVLRVGVETLFSTHVFTFNGAIYSQVDGGPIGLRSTCAISRVVMAGFTVKWNGKVGRSVC